MKKMFMMMAMASIASSAFAQDDLVKQAKKLQAGGDFDKAIEVLTPALTSDATVDKAAAWNQMFLLQQAKFNAIQEVEVNNRVKQTTTPYDTVGMHRAAVEALKAAIKCDEYDQKPNAKGKVKIRFRAANAPVARNVRLNVINAGMYEYNKKNMTAAMENWKLYVDTGKDPLFSEIKEMEKDDYRAEICYYVGLSAYNLKDYATATKYAKMAAEDPAKAADANEILLFAQKDGAKTKEDSLAYLNTIKDLHAKKPGESRYFNLLLEYYTRPGRQNELGQWATEEITRDPNNKMAWALKGEVEMNKGQWDDAIASYQKASEIDPSFVQVVFNTGVCYNSKAIELKDKLADKKTGGLTNENADKVKAVLNDAKTYLEKARELDPTRSTVNWAYPLYQIYYSLGDKQKSAEMEALINGN